MFYNIKTCIFQLFFSAFSLFCYLGITKILHIFVQDSNGTNDEGFAQSVGNVTS